MSGRLHTARELSSRLAPYLRASWPLGAPATRFVVLAAPRTGSELLVALLDSHPDIACDSELFKEPHLLPRRYLRGMAARRKTAVYGFKLIDTQLRWQLSRAGFNGEFLDELVTRDGFKVFYLGRRDRLAQALSFVHAAQTQYHFRGDEKPAFQPMTVDPAALISYLHVLDDNAEWADAVAARVPHVRLTYEDDLLNPDAQQRTTARMCTELGVTHAVMQSDLRAPAPSDAWARVANRDEVAAALRTTRFAGLAEQLGESHATGVD